MDGFSGPFELLLRLIERGQLDVLAISLAVVTEQYLGLLTELHLRDPEHLSAFLVVAAKLLLIKSRLLLPAPPERAGSRDLDDPTDLTEKLRAYQRFRLVASWLGERLDAGLRSHPHVPPPYQPGPRPPEPLNPVLLRDAFQRAQARPKSVPLPISPGDPPPYSIADALATLREALRCGEVVRFGDLVGGDRGPSVHLATFLAVLEATRLELASVDQSERYGEIFIRRPSATS